MIYDIVFSLACIGLLATMVTAVLWIIKRLFHWHKIDWLKGKHVGFIFLASIVLTFAAPATQTKAQRAEQARQDRADTISESRDKAASESSKAKSSALDSSKAASESRTKLQNRADSSKKDASSKKAKASVNKSKSESRAKAKQNAESVSHAKSISESKKAKSHAKKSANRPNTSLHYKYVSLNKLTENPYKYDGGLIKTTGNVLMVQKNGDDHNMYYVVIAPKDSYSSSGYSDGHGSVTEIDIDTMKEHSIHEGDKITVYGSVMEGTVKLNGKTLKTDIIVDRVSK